MTNPTTETAELVERLRRNQAASATSITLLSRDVDALLTLSSRVRELEVALHDEVEALILLRINSSGNRPTCDVLTSRIDYLRTALTNSDRTGG